ncbi:MAG TPA: metal-dependent transcriptional regulator [Thermoclostridium sp.]|nr:metal-dependent transcriptional regulator [Thermoclostridium sp.]
MSIQESGEMYLETILILSRKKANVRSIDVANRLDYRKSSVSVAMKKLRESGYIAMSDEGYITLTDAGRHIAESMLERHNVISDWLITLGVEEEIAIEDACRVEHVISSESFEAIKKHVEVKRDAKIIKS